MLEWRSELENGDWSVAAQGACAISARKGGGDSAYEWRLEVETGRWSVAAQRCHLPERATENRTRDWGERTVWLVV